MKFYHIATLLLLSFFTFCAHEMTKDDYVSDYTSFIQEVEANKSNYSEKDWEEKDSIFSLYQTPIPLLSEGSENYKKFSQELTQEENILAPGTGKNMGDGWETRRSRGKNYDWLILKCATSGKIGKIQIDTHHFKGNYPNKCSLQAANLNGKISTKNIINKSKNWSLLLNKVKLNPHKKHNFSNRLMKNKKINYIRINIYPDGGISRIRVFGKAD